jgi:hypothetical protein
MRIKIDNFYKVSIIIFSIYYKYKIIFNFVVVFNNFSIITYGIGGIE